MRNHHIDFSSKRAQLALRFFTYGVMTLATVLLTILAVFYAMGYRFNQTDLAFEQGGLLQFRSFPAGAQIYVDGRTQNIVTPDRANFGSGTHTVEMRLDGYRPWQKTISLAPGQLLWLDYARLLPSTITTTAVAQVPSATDVVASPDHKWFIVQKQANQPAFSLIDVSDPKKPVVTSLDIPDSQLTKKNDAFGTFAIKEWDLSSRYILVEHTNGDAHEFIRIDRQHANAAINVSRLFSLNITDAHFAGSNPNLLYAKTDLVLRSLDISSHSASAALVTGLDDFSVYGNDVISFSATRNAKDGDDATKQRVAGLYIQGKETVIRTYPANTKIGVAYSEYTRHEYMAIDGGNGIITVLRDPTSNNATTVADVNLSKTAAWMKFSSNGRMLVIGNGATIATYDLELDKQSHWQVPGAAPTEPLQWLDDYYLMTDSNGSLRTFEFDGTNDRDITSVAPGLAAAYSQDNNYLFSFAKNASGSYDLQASLLVKQ